MLDIGPVNLRQEMFDRIQKFLQNERLSKTSCPIFFFAQALFIFLIEGLSHSSIEVSENYVRTSCYMGLVSHPHVTM